MNFKALGSQGSRVDWNSLYNNENPLFKFYHQLIEIFNYTFPVLTLNPKPKKPWIAKGINISADNIRCR